MKKIYLAGPDVFRKDAYKHFENMKKLCDKYGFIGLSPFDNDNTFDGEAFSSKHSVYIFKGNLIQIKNCDIIIANLIPFRGCCVDDGTAWELGCGYAQDKILYGYTPHCTLTLQEVTNQIPKLIDEFPNVETFGRNCVNLMLQESIELSGGKILATFEDCLIDLKTILK